MKEEEDKVLKNGLVGKLAGWRIHGKSYDAEGNEIKEVHEKDCFCCRKDLFKQIFKQIKEIK